MNVIRWCGGALLVMGALFVITPAVQAEATMPNSAGALTTLQLLLETLQSLQNQLSQLQETQTAATVAASWAAPLAATTTATSAQAYDIVIVAGQSNSVGFGEGTYTEDPQLMVATNTAKVFQLGRFNDHDMKIIPVTHDPLEFWGASSTYAMTTNGKRGSSYPFALRLAATEKTGRKVLVIPAALGGTTILRWDRVLDTFGRGAEPDSTILYDDMVARVKFALAQNPTNRVVAVIWRQGEADINALKGGPYHALMSTSTYQAKLFALRYNLRQDLASQGCFSFLYGEPTKQWLPGDADKAAITNVIKYVVTYDTCKKSAFIPSDNTSVNPGTIHFDAPGQWEMAKRMWSAYQGLTGCTATTSLTVGASYVTKDSFQIRKGPGYTYPLYAAPLATGTRGTLTDGPVFADKENWFNVSYATGAAGWSRNSVIRDHAASITYRPCGM